ncbi:MAG: phosphotransferase family protein [Mycobacteriales bacterium]
MAVAERRSAQDTCATLAAWWARREPGVRPPVLVEELVTPTSTGFSSQTVIFTASWVGEDGPRRERLVARIAPTGHRVFLAPRFDLEYQVMQVLAQRTDVPVPPLYPYEEDPAVLGAPFFVMGFVPGDIPTDMPPYHTGGWLTEVRPQDRERLWWSGLDVLARVHRLDPVATGLAFLSDVGQVGLAAQLDYYAAYLEWAAEGRPQPVAEAALEWLRAHQVVEEEPPRLQWGDARIGNMVFQDFRAVAVLDWEMATLGPPEVDLAWWLFLDRHHSEGCGVDRLAGFPSREATVARYEQLLGRPVRHLDYYEVFAGFRFTVVMVRLMHLFERSGVLPPGSDADRDNTVSRLTACLL